MFDFKVGSRERLRGLAGNPRHVRKDTVTRMSAGAVGATAAAAVTLCMGGGLVMASPASADTGTGPGSSFYAQQSGSGSTSSSPTGGVSRATAKARLAVKASTPSYFGYESKPVTPAGESVAHSVWFGVMDYNGVKVFCIDGKLLAPSQAPSKPISKSDQAKLAYLTSRYTTSTDKVTVAAVSYIARQLLDPGFASFDSKAFATLDTSVQAKIKAKVSALNSEASRYAGPYQPAVTNTAAAADKAGSVSSGAATVAVRSASGADLAGVKYTATISRGTFAGGKKTVTGTTGTSPVKLSWAADSGAKNGAPVTVKVSYTSVPSTSYYEYDSPNSKEQRVISAAPATTLASAPVIARIVVPTPTAHTKVSTTQWVPGSTLTDVLTTSGVSGSPKVTITATAAITARPAGTDSCSTLDEKSWAGAVKAKNVTTVATATVKNAATNADVNVPLHLAATFPAGTWCGSITETITNTATGKVLLTTPYGAVNEWGHTTVAKPKPPVKAPPVQTGGHLVAAGQGSSTGSTALMAAGAAGLVGVGAVGLRRRRRNQG